MKICANKNISFQRRLKPNEEAEYIDVLKKAKTKAGNTGKSVLIVPASSLPNKTGVGNVCTEESQEFFDFAKKYWGINEIQILPSGQYHEYNGEYPVYSGTSMDLGNHIINVKNYLPENDYNELVAANKNNKYVNFSNVVNPDSEQEKALKKLFLEGKFKDDFQKFKAENSARLEGKALYRALREINGTNDYKKWNETDKNLFNPDIVKKSEREKRINEVRKLKGDTMDFYYFKQFLAEDSLKDARIKLNQKGMKLNGDMLCGFSFDEIWSNPKAFYKDTSIGWGLPALNLNSEEGKNLLKQKVKFYAERFDGIRIDAAWTYANQPLYKPDGLERKNYADTVLNIIEDEVKNVKGADYDLKNIMYEFATSADNFNIYDNSTLKPYLKDRMKIYTSDYLSESWGSNKNFLDRGWSPESFIIGASNHDSKQIEVNDEQAKALSEILNIPYKKLTYRDEFVKAKFAEPFGAKNNMLYFMDALDIEGQLCGNNNRALNYTAQIPLNYKDKYFRAAENGRGFNPMDALEKIFKANGLDKKEPDLYKKIKKYRKILQEKETHSTFPVKAFCAVSCLGLALYGLYRYNAKKNFSKTRSQKIS